MDPAGHASAVVTAARFAQGMTIAQYLDYIGTPENLAREASWWLGSVRRNWSGPLRAWYERARVTEEGSPASAGWPRSPAARPRCW